MHATLHQIDDIPGPHDTGWVDDVLSAIGAVAAPSGSLVMRPLGPGPGHLIVMWADAEDAAAAQSGLGQAGSVRVGPGRMYEVSSRKAGVWAQPARYLQLLTFDGPRSVDWTASYARASEERIWPAVRDVAGIVEHLDGRAGDGSCLSATLAESVEALEAAGTAIMSTTLLPGENPDHLAGPDSFAIHRLLHADLPVGANR